jgi:hypothetical protein
MKRVVDKVDAPQSVEKSVIKGDRELRELLCPHLEAFPELQKVFDVIQPFCPFQRGLGIDPCAHAVKLPLLIDGVFTDVRPILWVLSELDKVKKARGNAHEGIAFSSWEMDYKRKVPCMYRKLR